MLSHCHILILAASASIAFAGGFCDYGVVKSLDCSDDSLLTGIETTSELFSADATPVCSKLAGYILPDHKSFVYFYKANYSDFNYYNIPKALCKDFSYAIKSLSLCLEDGDVTATIADCRRLKRHASANVTYALIGKPDSRKLECGADSVMHSIKYDRSSDGESIAFVNCTTLAVGADEKEEEEAEYCEGGQIVEVVCPDGYLVTGVETPNRLFSPDVTPVCSRMTDILENPGLYVTSTQYYHSRYPHPIADCDEGAPVLLKFDICFVNSVVTATRTQCRRLQENVTVSNTFVVEGRTNSSVLKCPEGSFFHGLRTEHDGTGWYTSSDETDVRVRTKCSTIGE